MKEGRRKRMGRRKKYNEVEFEQKQKNKIQKVQEDSILPEERKLPKERSHL